MARHSFAVGVHIYIGRTRYQMVASFPKEGVEHWELKNTKNGVRTDKPRTELEHLYDEGDLRFDGDRDEDTEDKRRERRRRHGVPLSDMDPAKQKRVAFRRAVIRTVDERTAPGTKTAKVIVNGAATGTTVLQALLDELGRTLGLEHLGKEQTVSQATYYRWCAIYRAYDEHRDLGGDHDQRGNRKQLHPLVARIMKEEMAAEIEAARHRNQPGGKVHPVMASIMGRVLKRVKAERLRHPGETLRMPEKTTFYNHWNEFDARLRDIAKYGLVRARQMHRFPRPSVDPEHALDLVQFDETRLPIFVIDEILGIPLGRPWLAWLVDVYTGAIIGVYLGFEPPGDLVIGSTLRHAASMKSYVAKEYPGLPPWRFSGLPRHMTFDNSLQAHGRTIQTIAGNLDIPYDFTPARMPWTKSEVEGAFQVANTQWLQEMNGFVLAARDEIDGQDYDPTRNAVMGFRHLFYILHCWLLEVYHQKPTPGTRLSPDQRWSAGTAQVDPEFPEDGTDLDLMFGIVREGQLLDHRGVVYENIRYYSEGLSRVRDRNGHSLKVRVKVNPLNLGKIHVWDPKVEMWIPATAREMGYGDYAEGLELHCHKLYLRHADRLSGRKSLEALIESRLHLQDLIAHALPDALSIRTNTLIARAMGVGSQHIIANLDAGGNLPRLTGPFAGLPLNPLLPPPQPVAVPPVKQIGGPAPAAAAPASEAPGAAPVRPRRAIPTFKTNRSIGRG
ncbi:Mu transposase C-terminal domain-containing protein [Microvirga arsenatis]|uniref:DDE-type integrase/transposase/recombinase n=1 Tax=Microvirga arsenatis TaxID=2692265 RepID=A0ABW9YVP1_9HYPH|nr:Mu transposase C-terminal domain-containing protein [Microvirga arsenatis]NBJ09416.1 DDE-type integrase/transposase/recombinase [Microvirga arsenatis]NBJ23726.1 DDE-type integrase/transposase/recombinase [Microvirga arsenatis]